VNRGLELAVRGRLGDVPEDSVRALIERAPGVDEGLVEQVRSLIEEVQREGDAALRSMAERFDGVELERVEVPREAWEEALAGLEPGTRAALERAAANIRSFHEAQRPDEIRVVTEPGVVVTRCWTPLRRVGVYAPGGTAAYPSSVLMGVVPARAAGVEEVVVCSPAGPGGRPPVSVLAACAIGGADRVFAIGGAGAVAAMAFGTETVPAVDAIVGPGNRWVTEAKRQLAGTVTIDSPAGPSEILVLTDDTADPELVAVEVLAQAEHDPDAACLVVTTSESVAALAEGALQTRLEAAERASIARAALARAGGFLIVDNLDEAVVFAERFAAEHLSVMTRDAPAVARRMRNAGTIFVGASASVAFGDYLTGANHVLPTAGRSRSFSGLSTQHFFRSFTVQEIDEEGATRLAGDVAQLARAEGLPAHAEAALARADTGRAVPTARPGDTTPPGDV
jgi:histidinol dehydrogenase